MALLERFQSKIDSFQAVVFTVLGIIVAALSFLAVNEFGGIQTKDPEVWQVVSWIVVLATIFMLALVLAAAAWRALFRR